MNTDEFIDVNTAIEITGHSRTTITNYIKSLKGSLFVKKSGHKWVVSKDKLLEDKPPKDNEDEQEEILSLLKERINYLENQVEYMKEQLEKKDEQHLLSNEKKEKMLDKLQNSHGELIKAHNNLIDKIPEAKELREGDDFLEIS